MEKLLGQVEEDLGYGRNTLYKIKTLRQMLSVSQKLLTTSTYPPIIYSDGQIILLLQRMTRENAYLGPAETELVAAFRNQTQNMTEEEKGSF